MHIFSPIVAYQATYKCPSIYPDKQSKYHTKLLNVEIKQREMINFVQYVKFLKFDKH